jgi:hypothetical protein
LSVPDEAPSDDSLPEPVPITGENPFPELDALPEGLRPKGMTIAQLITQGWVISPVQGHTTDAAGQEYLRLRSPDYKQQKRITEPMLWPILQALQGRLRPQQKEAKEKEKAKAGTGSKSATVKLGEGTAFDHRWDPGLPLITDLIKKTEHYQKMIFQMGQDCFLISMQTAKINPADLALKLSDFEEGDKMISFVRDRLVALVQASKNGDIIQIQTDEIRALSGKLIWTEQLLEMYAKQKAEFEKRLQIAISCMDKDAMGRFLNAILMGDVVMKNIGNFTPGGNGGNGKGPNAPPSPQNNYGEFS